MELASGDLGDAAGGQLGDPHAFHELLPARRDLGARTQTRQEPGQDDVVQQAQSGHEVGLLEDESEARQP